MKAIITKIQETLTKAQKDDVIEPLESKATDKFAKFLRTQGDIFLDRFKKHKTMFQESVQDVDPDIRFTLDTTEGELRRIIVEVLEEAYKAGGDQQFAEFTNLLQEAEFSGAFDLSNPRAEQWIQERGAAMVTRINETTRDNLNTILSESMENGWSYNKTAREINSRFDDFAGLKPQGHIRSRAHLIAVTENAEAFGQGNMEAAQQMEDMGLQIIKFWSNTGDGKVSGGCISNTSAGWIPREEPFPSGHEREPRFPGCRCRVLYDRKKNE